METYKIDIALAYDDEVCNVCKGVIKCGCFYVKEIIDEECEYRSHLLCFDSDTLMSSIAHRRKKIKEAVE